MKKRNDPSVEDQLLLLEHEPVYTIGRTPDRSSLSATGRIRDGEVGSRAFAISFFRHQPRRPGHLSRTRTTNGLSHHRSTAVRPGFAQIFALARTIAHGSSRQIRDCRARRESLTGVWVGDRKIASIGVGVRHWITMHGFALNVCGDLSPFDHIVPCGINNVAMTSIEKETKRSFPVADCTHD